MVKTVIKNSFNLVQRLFLGYENNVLTFSQAGEDFVIRNYFYDQIEKGKPGFFLDIGSFHPYLHSNTFYLYRCGWRGINIDARPGSKILFDKMRPLDINIEAAVSDREGEIEYHCFDESPGKNTVSRDFADLLGNKEQISKSVRVKSSRLESLLREYLPQDQHIDFLSIDIEGGEEAALASNNWESHRFSLIAIEMYGNSLDDVKRTPTAVLLNDQGYELYARVLLSTPHLSTVFFVER